MNEELTESEYRHLNNHPDLAMKFADIADGVEYEICLNGVWYDLNKVSSDTNSLHDLVSCFTIRPKEKQTLGTLQTEL